MKQLLQHRLHSYLAANNPDILVSLQSEKKVTDYLVKKVDSLSSVVDALLESNLSPHLIVEKCMEDLTADLRPSIYHLIAGILADEFEQDYTRMRESGTLTYEIINLISACKSILRMKKITEDSADDRKLRYALAGCIQDYLWTSENV